MIETRMIEDLFVGGDLINAAASGNTFDVTNPANSARSTRHPPRCRLRRDAARYRRRAAVQQEWAATTAHHRAAIMREAARLMHERKEHLARVMTLEQDKPLLEAQGEIVYAASFIE